ncbi:amino acid permease [Segnochrobactrum spirostomi]|uniref:Amino acid permease n=1 Tax=Segnochrobactrum spirostomi TaxID=2608987 RepID=A0A6A7XZ26_9HYPH|nr:amino acid permease [Segnochrobactrum spirostomi]MQT12040.1 amino acid permease [Segnochrobactrum spirostomi]
MTVSTNGVPASSNADGSLSPDENVDVSAFDKKAWLASHDHGLHHGLSRRQVQMIAIGGAIGTGLFLGAGARLQQTGPSLAIVYLVCGVFAFLILRALGELVMHRPSSGSFVSYAREFLGEGASYVAGWLYFLNWAMAGIVDITAVALYMHYWSAFGEVPQWVFALIAMCLVTALNLINVKYFGEMEFWFAVVKVGALSLFLIVGTVLLSLGIGLEGYHTGFTLITNHGGFFPHGMLPALVLVQGVVFAYAGVELIGIAAGECKDVRTVLPKAVNGVIWRIALFYVGSVILLVCLLPWSAYSGSESPFVTLFKALGVPGIGSAMNVVVLTAALSSLNSGLYSTGRVLRSLAMGGSAPPVLAKLNAHSVPFAGIMVTVSIYAIGVVLNYLVPASVFELVINIASLGILSTWAFILVCQLRLRAAIKRGEAEPVSFRMPGAPFTTWITLAFLAGVLVLMAFDYPHGTFTVASIPVLAILLYVGWHLLKRVHPMNPTIPSAVLTQRVLGGGEGKAS